MHQGFGHDQVLDQEHDPGRDQEQQEQDTQESREQEQSQNEQEVEEEHLVHDRITRARRQKREMLQNSGKQIFIKISSKKNTAFILLLFI